jgi:hypothetical protein
VSLAWNLAVAKQNPSDGPVSGPFTHENLSLFLVKAEKGGSSGARRYVTLQDAISQKKAVVHETEEVNELAVENVSDQDVFIQTGDIVKGGQQDRVITNDFVLRPKSGRVSVDAFCVEQGRWSQRGRESASTFNSSREMVSSKPLKMAVGVKKDQSEVWREVGKTQADLALSTAETVTVTASASSLPLTLQSRPVEGAVKGYLKALRRVPNGSSGAIGVVVAVNGEINSADIYSSPELFAAMWPKLLKASAVEAVRLKRQEPSGTLRADAVDAFLREAEQGAETAIDIDGRITLARRENEQQITMESRDPQGWIHRSILKK